MNESAIILNFHGIGTPHEGVDPTERPYWISPEFFRRILDHAAKWPQVGFTFDDGNSSDVPAAAMLEERGLRGAFFVLAGRFGLAHYLTREDCRALREAGHEVGLHGRHHVDWRQLDDTALADETERARTEVETAAGGPVESVGIPFGAYNRRVIAHLRRTGFHRIYTSDGGLAGRGDIRNRTSIRADMTLDQVAAILAGREPASARLRRLASTFVRRHLK